MDTQSISASSSLAQTFTKSFGSVNQAQKNEINSNSQIQKPTESAAKPNQSSVFHKSIETGSAMSKPNFSFSRTESLNLQIKTKEGDLVTIRFNRMESSHSGVAKMELEGSGSGGEGQAKVIKSESSLGIESNTKNETKPAPSESKEVLYDTSHIRMNNRSENIAPKTIEATIQEPPLSKKDAGLASISHLVPSDIKEQDKKILTDKDQVAKTIVDTQKNKDASQQKPVTDALPSSPNKIEAHSRSELQMEQGGNKIVITSEQTYSFESAKNYIAGEKSIPDSQNSGSRKEINESPKPNPNPIAADSTVAGTHDNSAVDTVAKVIPAEQPANTKIAGDEVSKASLQNNHSVIREDSNGGSYSFKSDFNLSIEGDLNAEEQQSISELLKAMSQVSQDFFQGNVSNAFSQAQNMGLETEQIAGFSMNMNSQKSVQAMAAYQQTKMPEQNIDTNILSQASDFLAQAKQSIAETKSVIDSFAAPEQSFTDMFAGVGQMFSNDQENDPQHNTGDMFLKVVENISQDLFSTS